jgi:microcompartment protein CcmL/EutN
MEALGLIETKGLVGANAGAAAARRVGEPGAVNVIPRLHEEVEKALPGVRRKK